MRSVPLRASRLAQSIRRLLLAPALTLDVADAIMPVVVVSSPRAEQAFDREELLWAAVANVGSAIGINAKVIFGPAATGTVVVLTRLRVMNRTAAGFLSLDMYQAPAGDRAGLTPTNSREARVGFTGAGLSQVAQVVMGPIGVPSAVVPALTSVLHQFAVTLNTENELILDDGVVLTFPAMLRVTDNTPNESIQVTAFGYARMLDQMELQRQ